MLCGPCFIVEAQRQCKLINQEHGRSRGSRFCVRTPWSEDQSPKPEPEPEAELISQNEINFAHLLTVIITTSPTASNPCTRLIASIVRSLGIVDGLLPCRKIIVCDGYVCGQKCNYKRGRITQDAVGAYQQYLRKLETLSSAEFVNTELLLLETRHGFSFAVRRALELVETRFVLVVQHDRLITRSFDLGAVLHAFDAFPRSHGSSAVKYVAFQTRQTVAGAHQARVCSRANGKHVVFPPPLRMRRKARAKEVARQDTSTRWTAVAEGDDFKEAEDEAVISLEPLAFWYDSTHCCEANHYREFIFQETLRREEKIADEDGSRTRLRLGDFVEDTVGHQLLNAVKKAATTIDGFIEAHEPYGTYLWNDAVDEVHVRHIDGRKYLSPEQRVELGYSKHGPTKFEAFDASSTKA